MIAGILEPNQLEKMIVKVESFPRLPRAIEAFWNGDSKGWMIIIAAIVEEPSVRHPQYTKQALLVLRGAGGDMRLFNGQVPPWPEAERAKEIGETLATRFGVPFFFPSPNHPEEDCPRWWEQDQGVPCGRCGILLLQPDSCPWRGVCYECHLKEEQEKKEAAWTPEERAGLRCEICGRPAKGTLLSARLCQKCLDEYEGYYCSRCGVRILHSKTICQTEFCSHCNLLAIFDSLTEDQREIIRRLAKSGKMIEAIKEVRRFLRVPLSDAKFIVEELAE